MKSCLISAPSYSHLSAIFAIRRIYKPDNITLTGEQEFILNRRFALGVDFLQKHPEIETIIARVNKYNQKLKSLGIKDEDVVDLTRRYVWDLVSIMRTFSLFVLSAAFVFLLRFWHNSHYPLFLGSSWNRYDWSSSVLLQEIW